MAVTSFIVQPPANSLYAAYRPIVFRAVADGAIPPPRVYCDIYFGGIYYRSISKTAMAKQNESNSEWIFDIQDATQEYLRHYLAPNGGNGVIEADSPLVRVQCKFRASNYNAQGFIQQETPIPIQATGNSAATAGGGFASNTFFVLNASLEHSDNQNLASHLATFKKGTWAATNYPATHRPNQKIGVGDSDYFPALMGDELCGAKLTLNYRIKGSTSFNTAEVELPSICSATIVSVTVAQETASTNANVSWTFTGSQTGFEYRLDGGAWLATAGTSIMLSALTEGGHVIEVRGICGCAAGAIFAQNFNIVSSSSACSSIVSISSISQNGDGSVSVSFSSSGPAISWQYSVDGGAFNPVPSNPFNATGISIGNHSLTIRPICAGGAIGTGDIDLFEIASFAPVYWYQVRFGASPCSSTPVIVYSTSIEFVMGALLFTDEACTNPLAGPPGGYIAAYMGNGLFGLGQVFNLIVNEIGSATGSSC